MNKSNDTITSGLSDFREKIKTLSYIEAVALLNQECRKSDKDLGLKELEAIKQRLKGNSK